MMTKRFRAALEKDEHRKTPGIAIPFNVQKVFDTRARVKDSQT